MLDFENSTLPLAKKGLFHSTNLDETRDIVAQKFCDHRLEQVSRFDHLNAVHNRAEGQGTSLNFIKYGADVEIEPGELGSFYLIQIPVMGHADIDNCAGQIATGPRRGSALNPHRHTTMRWRKNCAQLLLQIDQRKLNQAAERLLGRSLGSKVVFDTSVDVENPKVSAWVQNLKSCFALADREAIYTDGKLPTQVLVEEQLIEGFLLCQPSDISDLLDDGIKRVGNVHVRRAMRYIREHFDQSVCVGDIALMLGVSSRALQLGFKTELGMSPLQYLFEIRLREARYLITTASDGEMIGDICERVGFSHFGRFSVAYKRRFGESPHETRRART